jgi:hypothetical protein
MDEQPSLCALLALCFIPGQGWGPTGTSAPSVSADVRIMAWTPASLGTPRFESAWFPMAAYTASAFVEIAHGLGTEAPLVCFLLVSHHSHCPVDILSRPLCRYPVPPPLRPSDTARGALWPLSPGRTPEFVTVVARVPSGPNAGYQFDGVSMCQQIVRALSTCATSRTYPSSPPGSVPLSPYPRRNLVSPCPCPFL